MGWVGVKNGSPSRAWSNGFAFEGFKMLSLKYVKSFALALSCVFLVSTSVSSAFHFSAEIWSGRLAPAPTPGATVAWSYKYLGAETSYGRNQGVCAEISVLDSGVPHDGTCCSFFYAWIMVYSLSRAKWMQVGWSEVSWKSDTQYVTEYDTEHNDWHFCTQYALTVGHSYCFAISYQGIGRWAAWIWWNNQWNLIAQADIELYSAELTGEFCEVCTSTNNWFHVPNVSFCSTCLLTNQKWTLWTTQYTTTQYDTDLPYHVYWSPNYYNWHVYESNARGLICCKS
jgi:hypothetical protein